ncbi:aminopeptidase [Saxophila tyrrhenica]|uniref:Xaa-Pro aminopeptidase n=1 Tax=Saxophila tyrrhenica TaxID=1690608 RepID=A0AAV9P689_9PEZI|nr:aminopeptidase [Saxophila tyrrhenica]
MRRSALLPLRAVSRPIPTFRSRPCRISKRAYASVPAADLQFGQPLHETHPHIIKPGELTPGISALEYHHRRAALAQRLSRNSIAVLAANELKYRSGPVFYEYHQEPNFFYLTGFNEPEAVAVIEKGDTDVEYTFHLFVRPKDAQAELWDGARSGVQAAEDVFNADEAGDINNISQSLPKIVHEAKEVYTDIGSLVKKNALSRFFAGSSTNIDGFAKLLKNATVKSLRPLMNEVRVTKSEAELDCMRRAGSISGAVFTEAMKKGYKTEKQLWTDLAYGFKSQGLDGEAYVPVVAGGTNALSIHYVRNDAELRDGDMVLVDAGGEYGDYISDITRTWPVNGKFTAAQRDMYSMILAVQKSCVSLCREDADMTLDRLHKVAEDGLRSGLKDLGFDTSKAGCLDTLFPHHVGHYIGLDVHDAPGYPRTDKLKENHCITIEPGIYVPVDDERWPAHFRGLGIRIEDSVRIGKEKVEVLTSTAVKNVDEIEAMRS